MLDATAQHAWVTVHEACIRCQLTKLMCGVAAHSLGLVTRYRAADAGRLGRVRPCRWGFLVLRGGLLRRLPLLRPSRLHLGRQPPGPPLLRGVPRRRRRRSRLLRCSCGRLHFGLDRRRLWLGIRLSVLGGLRCRCSCVSCTRLGLSLGCGARCCGCPCCLRICRLGIRGWRCRIRRRCSCSCSRRRRPRLGGRLVRWRCLPAGAAPPAPAALPATTPAPACAPTPGCSGRLSQPNAPHILQSHMSFHTAFPNKLNNCGVGTDSCVHHGTEEHAPRPPPRPVLPGARPRPRPRPPPRALGDSGSALPPPAEASCQPGLNSRMRASQTCQSHKQTRGLARH